MIEIRRWARAALALVVTCTTLVVANPARAGTEDADPGSSVEAVVRSGLTLRTSAGCGSIRLSYASSTTDSTLLSRLPLDIYVSEPSRGLARTFVANLAPGNLGNSAVSPVLFAVAPSGRGPGLVVSLEWSGGTETVQTESYVDNCAGNFFPVSPTRLIDTRTGQGVATGTAGPVAANSSIVIDPVASTVVPSIGVTALVLNVTATEPATAGYLTVYPCGQDAPNTSNLNFAAGQTVPNLVVVDLVGFPNTGTVCIFASTATQILADVTGYYLANGIAAGSLLNSLPSPKRVLDTRATTKIAANTVLRVPMAGVAGMPATGITAVSMNITAVNAAGIGYLTAFPCDRTQPNSSNVNYIAGRAIPNAAVIGLSADGALCVFASQTTDVLIDVNGYTSATGLLYLPNAPVRIWDNRLDKFEGATGPRKLLPGDSFRFNLGIPDIVIALNVTAIDEEAGGYITVYPCDQGLPDSSNLNFQPGEAVANTVFVKTDNSGRFCVFTTARINFILDLNGTGL